VRGAADPASGYRLRARRQGQGCSRAVAPPDSKTICIHKTGFGEAPRVPGQVSRQPKRQVSRQPKRQVSRQPKRQAESHLPVPFAYCKPPLHQPEEAAAAAAAAVTRTSSYMLHPEASVSPGRSAWGTCVTVHITTWACGRGKTRHTGVTVHNHAPRDIYDLRMLLSAVSKRLAGVVRSVGCQAARQSCIKRLMQCSCSHLDTLGVSRSKRCAPLFSAVHMGVSSVCVPNKPRAALMMSAEMPRYCECVDLP
jgi:hypothetical protein